MNKKIDRQVESNPTVEFYPKEEILETIPKELAWALSNRNLKVLRHLIEVDLIDFRLENDYPLRIAAAKGCMDMVKYLVSKGADVKANKQGNFVGSDLELLSFETSDGNIKYEHKVIMRKDDTPSQGAGDADTNGR